MTDNVALIVDDEPDICELLSMTLEAMGITTGTAGNVAEARVALDRQRFDAVVVCGV